MDPDVILEKTVRPRLGLLSGLGFLAIGIALAVITNPFEGVSKSLLDWGPLLAQLGIVWGLAYVGIWIAMSPAWRMTKIVIGGSVYVLAVLRLAIKFGDGNIPREVMLTGIFIPLLTVLIRAIRVPAWRLSDEPLVTTSQFSIRGILGFTFVIAIWFAVIRSMRLSHDDMLVMSILPTLLAIAGSIAVRTALSKRGYVWWLMVFCVWSLLIPLLMTLFFVAYVGGDFNTSDWLLQFKLLLWLTQSYGLTLLLFAVLGRCDARRSTA